jgi:hypothetical protein
MPRTLVVCLPLDVLLVGNETTRVHPTRRAPVDILHRHTAPIRAHLVPCHQADYWLARLTVVEEMDNGSAATRKILSCSKGQQKAGGRIWRQSNLLESHAAAAAAAAALALVFLLPPASTSTVTPASSTAPAAAAAVPTSAITSRVAPSWTAVLHGAKAQ